MKFDGLNWEGIEKQIVEFGKKPPFDYVVIDDFFTKEFAKNYQRNFRPMNQMRGTDMTIQLR